MRREAPLTKTELKVLLNEIITPKMIHHGLNKYDGRYLWFNDFNEEGIKHVFHYQLLKGENAVFTYGNCFKFLPTYSQTAKIKNHKTDKSTARHLFETTAGWFSRTKPHDPKGYISHWGKSKCVETINNALNIYLDDIVNWWKDNTTIENNIQTITKRMDANDISIGGVPSFKLCKAFLLAKNGEMTKSTKLLEEHFERLRKYTSKFESLEPIMLERLIQAYTDANIR